MLLDAYLPNKLQVVDKLFEVLETERLTLVVSMLKNLDFAALNFTTPEEMSDQVDVETLMEQASETLGGGYEYINITEGNDLVSDYTNRRRDSLAEYDTLGIE